MELLTGEERARSHVHRLEIYRRAHDTDPALRRQVLAEAAGALRQLRARHDVVWEARLLHNRALVHFDRIELGRAEADLNHAGALFRRIGAGAAIAEGKAVLAQIALLRGEIVVCLETLDEAEAALPPGGVSVTIGECRYLALMQARLLPEALREVEQFVNVFGRAGRGTFATSAELDVALINLMMGQTGPAERVAAAAARSFVALGRPANAALARSIWLRARLASGTVARSTFESGSAAADALERAGWHLEALRTRLVLTRMALVLGSMRSAEAQLALAVALRRRGVAADRIELSETEALVRLATGDPARAERALIRGVELLESERSALGALELRAAATGMGSGLFELGLRIALASGSAGKVLAWAERQRGNALRLPPVRPPAHSRLRRLHGELRHVSAKIREAEAKGTPARGSAARQADIEAKIRDVTRRTRGAGDARIGIAEGEEIADALTRHALIEYVESDGRILAVTIAHGRSRLHDLSPIEAATSENEWLRFGLRSLTDGRTTAGQREAARGSAEASAVALDRALVDPLLPALGEAPVVIVPSGSLHAQFPGARCRRSAAAPSLSRRRAPSGSTSAAGHDRAAVRRRSSPARGCDTRRPKSARWPRCSRAPTVLHGKAATATATLAALDGAALAHLACHGHFRSDSPLFSSLQLADGPLNVYELQSLRRAPEIVVLSACDLAVSGVQAGNELLGLSAALLGMGTRTIIASVVPASDAATRRMMVDFHRRLGAGTSPAAALAGAQAKSKAAGFLCLGRG